ncbi:hypothetical protein H6F39_04335 [Anabaena sp. FACHB-1250]|uniref:Uncharacterized protein n=1 Tax=Dolichospermum flos-aquae LEGE 04289 TaxID=1828708 RepID=A0ACC5Q4B0_DOLFA|nr:hypothetical protein [Dolichospermum flos-aquae]MBD2140625.1 hypothetical protein [Anabaena sp. FACHB-1250]MBE9220358.1 hypothetical protein [Dolichospermum flos-aquae LEGE 04289]
MTGATPRGQTRDTEISFYRFRKCAINFAQVLNCRLGCLWGNNHPPVT